MHKKFFCIHGHFYQPPRENPGLDEVELQDSAYPYHDWNERVTAECYAPNTAARILDGDGKILHILNNYAWINFDFGPTLLVWLERHRPKVYAKILEADRESMARCSGHGNAIAQVYNHVIMPLASRRDKETQVFWGIRDFARRFGRNPEGMWLSETAVDLQTLEILADHGIRFTILSPYQAYRIRRLDQSKEWTDVTGARIDPSRPYRCVLSRGKFIDLFFYDGPISFSIAFDDSLWSGEALVRRIKGGFSDGRSWNQILGIATDGESYGHHRKFGEMALAYALYKIHSEGQIRVTNFGEFLAENPPEWEVEIHENTAWSCAHGVNRWKEDCGCRLNQGSHWNQKWRKPLRQGLNHLKDGLDRLFESRAAGIFVQPWAARNDFIDVVMDRSGEIIEKFFSTHAKRPVDAGAETVHGLKLLEMQRQGMLMFTSCGWFFDDISGLEATQVLAYADRAVQLARELGEDLEPDLFEFLSKARSNLSEWGSGVNILLEAVRPGAVDFSRVAVHWAISSLFAEYGRTGRLYCFDYERQSYRRENHGSSALAAGTLLLKSRLTRDTQELFFAVLHSGGPDFHCVARPLASYPGVDAAFSELFAKFRDGLLTQVLASIVKQFGEPSWTLKDLFLDERRRILSLVTEENSSVLERELSGFYEKNKAVMQHLLEEEVALPKGFSLVLEYLLSRQLERALDDLGGEESLRRISVILEEAETWAVKLDLAPLAKAVQEQLLKCFEVNDFEETRRLLAFSRRISLEVSLWEVQNSLYEFLANGAGKADAGVLRRIHELGKELGFHDRFFMNEALKQEGSS